MLVDSLREAARRRVAEQDLRTLAAECEHLLSQRGEASSTQIARQIVERLQDLLAEPGRKDGTRSAALDRFFSHLADHFSPEPMAVLASAQAYAAEPDAAHLIALIEQAEPRRQELFRRINRAPGGTAALIGLRRALLERLPKKPEWRALEADLLHLLSSWFNPGFLEMRQVSWRSPAQLLEQIIRHEAVHEIDGWDDLRRRLLPDRRCFAFFHPQLPEEPLIFVEVALLPEMAAAIPPLIDKKAQPLSPENFKVAVFYSISNCQPGLRGVSLGNFLIKRVAEELKAELPQLKTFCTLSPIPGFMAWLLATPDALAPSGMKPAVAQRTAQAREVLRQACNGDLASLAQHATLSRPAQQALLQLAALYLVHQSPQPGGDPVARFHLDNGARLERLNLQGNPSAKGLKQSAGLMVNYLYDLANIDACHDRFVHGEVAHSRAVSRLL
ncbi:MAG TPA: malonyl-CoA decarboxylase family protein [Ideonella sp.]|uniref:malonyl-CoA decarboxylase domain-containing protein n=1 Tax=Ideonella sp. TaxID=1929293 RepID=UPI002E3134EF|nr:malonyl-CoA decarboxylase family protein [Ideonella sp.]HEX5687046.1 malonyl-CoA decarboxylase family protein [Ideonella sp.]